MTDFKICEECNGPTQFIECKSNPFAAEWYCDKCHRSYLAREREEPSPLQMEEVKPRRKRA